MRKDSYYCKYILYAICFWVISAPLLLRMFRFGYATLGGWDSVTQIYPIMLYTSRVIREFFHALVTGKHFTFPMLEWTLGMGEDTIAALNWHGFGDPFYLLAALFSEEQMPYFYSFLFYFRVFLGGMAFILLIHEIDDKHSVGAYVIGALVYSFTGFTLQSNIHLIFVHAMMYQPLLLVGAERTIKEKKKWFLSLTVFLFALSGFYYLYIGSVALAVYVLYRLIRNKTDWKKALRKIGELIVEYVIGIGLAAVVFVPAVCGFLSSNRASVKTGFPFFMKLSELKAFWINIFLPQYNNYQVLSLCAVGVISLILVLLAKNKIREKFTMALMFLSMFIPIVSVVMSGFGECYDRWELIIIMYFAYLAIVVWDELYDLSLLQKIGIFFVYGMLLFWGKKKDALTHERFGVTILVYGIILVGILLVLPVCKRLGKKRVGMIVLFLLVVLTVRKDWKAAQRDREIATVRERNVVSELIGLQEDEFCRIDNERAWGEPRNAQNIALVQQYHGIAEYVSIENMSFTGGLMKWGVPAWYAYEHMNLGVDNRGILETLCNVKYFIGRGDRLSPVPYGFMKVKETEDKQWILYKNKHWLPMVYEYDSICDEQYFNKANGLEKQQIMLQAAAVEGYEGNVRKCPVIENNLHEIEYIVEGREEDAGNRIININAGECLTISALLKANYENYFYIQGLIKKNEIQISMPDGMYGDISNKPTTPDGSICCNLGTYTEDRQMQIEITFHKKQKLDLSKMKLFYYDFSKYDVYIANLYEKSLKNLTVERNHIECEMDLDKTKILCFAVPFSDGWSAFIDGKKVKTYRINDMFIGIEMDKGVHEIVLNYVTPGIKAGIIISLCTLMGIGVYMVMLSRKKHKEL